MNNALVLYEGKHGTAEKTAQVIAAMLANAKCLSIEDAPQEIEAYRSVITVFSFYGFDTALQTKAFLRRQRERMQGRNLIAVGVGLAKNDFPAYLSALAEATGRAADRTCFVPGQLRLSSLSPNDLKALQAFSQKAGMPLMDRGEFKVQDAIDAAEQLACHLSRSPAPMEPGQLLKEIKRYILAHNTLALATGTGDFVRCTPLE